VLVSKEIEITLAGKNITHLKNLGYTLPIHKTKSGDFRVPIGSKFLVRVEDLLPTCLSKVDVICDNCKKEKSIAWGNYNKYVHEDGKYYCNKCVGKLFGGKERIVTRLKNAKSFEQWCLDNKRQDILDRWDYKLNEDKPNEITSHSNKKYYFKCPRKLHESELKEINNLTSAKQEGSVKCKQCNSFAQWGIDNICPDFLEKYWDYGKNDKLGFDPWKISYGSSKVVYIKCQKVDYHGSYDIECCWFSNMGNRCAYCHGKKIHVLDSLGTLYPQVLDIWSDKNIRSPFQYAPFGEQKVWWKCPDGEHDDYYRQIANSNTYEFRCPSCQFSKGEKRIENWLVINNFKNIDYLNYKILNVYDKYYKPQKEYDGLLGLGNGNLSYDFYLPSYNLLIEYQGGQHEKYIKGFHKTKNDFIIQQEHDRRKKQYAEDNNIKLLPIWYWDFDNIEEILDKELIIN